MEVRPSVPSMSSRIPRALAIVAILLGAGLLYLGHDPVRAHPPSPGPAAAPGPTVSVSPAGAPRTPWLTGGTAASLVLYNGTRLRGVFAGADPLLPSSALYDPANETVWVAASSYVGELNGSTETGMAWIPVLGTSGYLALDNRTNVIYTSDPLSGKVTAINGTTRAILGTGSVQSAPEGLAVDTGNNTVFVANSANGTVSVLNATTLTSVGLLHVGKTPAGVAYDPTDNRIFVANSASKNISVINPTTMKVLGNVTIAASTPTHIVFDPARDLLVVDGMTGAADVIDPVALTIRNSIHAGIYIAAIGLNAAGTYVYVGDRVGETVTAVSMTTFASAGSFGVGSQPAAIVYDNAQAAILVVNSPASLSGVSNVTIASGASLKTSGAIALQHYPSATVWVAKRHSVYVYDGGSGLLLELNDTTFAVNRSAFVGYSPGAAALPGGLAWDPNDARFFVAVTSTAGTFVAIVSAATMTVVQDDAIGKQPAAIAFDATDDLAYVVNYASNNLTVLRGSTGATVGTGVSGLNSPNDAVWDASNDALYVSESSTNTVSVFDGANQTLAATVHVGVDPVALALDTGIGRLVVANAGSNNLSFVDPSTAASVASIPLAPGIAPEKLAYDPSNGTLEVTAGSLSSAFGDLELVNDSNRSLAGVYATVPNGNSLAYDGSSGLTVVSGVVTGVLSLVNLTVHPNLRIQSFTTLFENITVNTPTSFSVTAAAGAPPYGYRYWGLPAGCVTNDSAFLACTPNATGNFSVAANVTDSLGEWANSSIPLNVAPAPPPPLTINATLAPARVALGNSTIIRVNASGGATPYTYQYPSLPPGCQPANVSVLVCTPTQLGNYSIPIRLSDPIGDIDSATLALSVVANHTAPPPPPLTLRSVAVAPSPVALGSPVTITTTATGGAPPYAYVYGPVPPGCAPVDQANWSCIPTAVGTFGIDVKVTDKNGSVVRGSTNLTVSPSTGTTKSTKNGSGSGLPLGEIEEILGALAVVVVLILVGLLLTRRKPALTTPEPEEHRDDGDQATDRNR